MDSYLKYYDDLNKLQKKAVDTVDGPLLVLAGPGTGKTQLLSVRAASILKHKKIEPDNILILTYTKAASKEMKERLAKIIGLAGYDVEVSTFHSFANSILQESEEAANYVGDKIQMDDVEQVKAIEYILDHTEGIGDLRPFGAPYLYIRDIRDRIGSLKKDGITPASFERYLKAKKEWEPGFDEKHIKRLKALSIIYRLYEELKEGKNKEMFDDRGRYDFDDMILFATDALKKEKTLKSEYAERFKFVMVDEFQDTNGAQLELLFTLLSEKSPNLCCVGDDDQSIYRFQGASVGNFKSLKDRYPDIVTLCLEDNYRSSARLIDKAKSIIGSIPLKERTGEKLLNAKKEYGDISIELGEFSTEEEELVFIVEKVKELTGHIAGSRDLGKEERSKPYNNIAILVRKRDHILKIIDALLQAGIPYATDGKEDVSGEKRVKQLLDVLELAYIDPADHEAKDLALYKVLTQDYFQLPLEDILKFMNYVNTKRGDRTKGDYRIVTILGELLAYFAKGSKDIKFKYEERLRNATEVIRRLLSDADTRSVHGMLLDFIKDSGMYKFVLTEYHDKDILRIRELRALTSFINMVKASDLANPAIRLDEFMSEMKTRKDHGIPIQGSLVTLTQDGVRVFTAHGSKGLEFHSVIIPFCLQNKSWPLKPFPDKIPMPSDLFKGKERPTDRVMLKQLQSYDETRLFYVAMTRAKANLIFTASPSENTITSPYMDRLALLGRPKGAVSEEETLTKFVETTDLKDPFIGTEDVLKDMVANMTLNPTRLNNYLSCRRKFLYNDVLKLPGPKKKSLVFGNCVHKALEDVYTQYQKTNTFPTFAFLKKAFERELKFQGVERTIQLQCLGRDQMKKLKDWFDLAAKNPVMPIGLERKLYVTIGENIIFTGKYDKVEWHDEKRGFVRILDYKTGKPDKHIKALSENADIASDDCDGYLRQLVAYKLLFERDKSESKGRKVACGALVFIEPAAEDMRKLGYKKGQHITKIVDITDVMANRLENLIIEVWDNIKGLKFNKLDERDKDKCGNCDFDPMCWG